MTRLALIGAGRFGLRYVETIQSLPNVSLTHIVSTNPKIRALYKNTFKVLDHVNQLFDYDEIDGIIITTPAATHAAIAKVCLTRGKNILVEKPFTTSLKDAQELYDLSLTSKTIAMVGHTYLFHPGFKKIAELKKKLGKITLITATAGNWGPFRSDVSALWDWSPHDVAMVLALLKQMPAEVYARGISIISGEMLHLDTVHIQLTFPDNINVLIDNSRVFAQKKRELSVIGTKGSLILDDLAEKKVQFFPRKGADTILKSQSNSSEGIPISYQDTLPLENEINEFSKCIESNTQPISSILSGLQVVKILTLAEQSARSNGEKMVLTDV